jgi:small-conductance mechanosensitive channel
MNWNTVVEVMKTRIFKLGTTQLSLILIAEIALLVLLLFWFVSQFRKKLLARLLDRTTLDASGRQLISSVVQYVLVLIGLLVILQTAGIDLTTLNVLAGALGIGIGFGLQTISSNFISGLIILLERPVKIGDRIEVGDVEGKVIEIRARSTTVLTNDGIAILVPNASFISENVINWSYTDDRVRFKIPVGVSYDSDPRQVEQLLLEVARENSEVLQAPEAPIVRFMAFGASSLDFELRVWSSSAIHRRARLISNLNFAIFEKFRQHGIEIPFPQRDLHVRSGSLDVRIDRSAPSA